MQKTIDIIESFSQWTGRAFSLVCLGLVLLLTFEVFMRYVLNAPTQFSYEVASSMGVAIGAGGLAYTHLHGGHVRVDVFWKSLSPKGKAIADIIGSLIFLFPLFIFLTWISAQWAIESFINHEVMTTTFWYPIAWPIRTVMVWGLIFLLPQAVAEILRNICVLKGIELKKVEEL